jgi:hypothetical protein
MSETGTTWRLAFKGHPSEAREVRQWTAFRSIHPDAPAVANELFVAVLASGPATVDVELSTAGDRLRITATGPDPLPLRHSHGPGWPILAALSRSTGVTSDERGLWALLAPDDEGTLL